MKDAYILFLGGSSEIVHKPSMQDDPKKRKPDITRAKTYLNWQPKVGVTSKLISAFVFATWIVHFLFFLNPKFQASSLLL